MFQNLWLKLGVPEKRYSMAGAPGVRDKLNLIVGGDICEVYRDGFNRGSFGFWCGLIGLAVFAISLVYFHMNRERIDPIE